MKIPLSILTYGQYVLLGIGATLLLATGITHYVKRTRENRNYISFGAINDSSDSAHLSESGNANETTPLIID